MKQKIFITLVMIFIGFSNQLSAQQIGNGFASLITDFTVPLNSGIYNGINASQTDFPIGTTPDNSTKWQHLFVMRHSNPNNNHQLQIASSFAVNDKIYFRKIAGGNLSTVPLTSSPWIELATRGTNTFVGGQQIKGNLSLDGGNPNSQINFESQNGFHRIAFNELRFWDWQTGEAMTINDGNVGIGTTNPINKLDVNGTIHSKEVKVDMIGWPDFVFKKEYNLPTLEEVEKHINKEGHLANIPNEADVIKNGVYLGEMNAKLLQKIEELTLYMIDFKKEIDHLKIKNKIQEDEINTLKKIN